MRWSTFSRRSRVKSWGTGCHVNVKDPPLHSLISTSRSNSSVNRSKGVNSPSKDLVDSASFSAKARTRPLSLRYLYLSYPMADLRVRCAGPLTSEDGLCASSHKRANASAELLSWKIVTPSSGGRSARMSSWVERNILAPDGGTGLSIAIFASR